MVILGTPFLCILCILLFAGGIESSIEQITKDENDELLQQCQTQRLSFEREEKGYEIEFIFYEYCQTICLNIEFQQQEHGNEETEKKNSSTNHETETDNEEQQNGYTCTAFEDLRGTVIKLLEQNTPDKSMKFTIDINNFQSNLIAEGQTHISNQEMQLLSTIQKTIKISIAQGHSNTPLLGISLQFTSYMIIDFHKLAFGQLCCRNIPNWPNKVNENNNSNLPKSHAISPRITASICSVGYYYYDSVCNLCNQGYFNSNAGTTPTNVLCTQCQITCKSCDGPTLNDCKVCQATLQKSQLFDECRDTDSLQADITRYNRVRNYDCAWKDRDLCDERISFSESTASLNEVLSIVAISLGAFGGLFLPHVSFATWMYVQNQQLIGDNALSNQFSNIGLSKLHLTNCYAFHLFVLFKPLFADSTEMFKEIDYYSLEILHIRRRSLWTPIEGFHLLYIDNVFSQTCLVILSILIVPVLFQLGRISILFQHLYRYARWNLLIRMLMLCSNLIILSFLVAMKEKFYLSSEADGESTIKIICSFVLQLVFLVIWIGLYLNIASYFLHKQRQSQEDQQGMLYFKVLFQNLKETSTHYKLFWILYEAKKVTSIGLFVYSSSNSTINYWVYVGLDAAFLMYLIIYPVLTPKHLSFMIIILQFFQVIFHLLLALISQLNSNENTVFTISKVFIILMAVFHGYVIAALGLWILYALYQLYSKKKREHIAMISVQTQMITQQLQENIENILSSSFNSSKKRFLRTKEP